MAPAHVRIRSNRQQTGVAADLGLLRVTVKHVRAERHQGGRAGDDEGHLDEKTGLRAPRWVARPAKSMTPVTRLTIRPTVTAGNTQRKADNGTFPVDAEQAHVEHPARADQHTHSHGVETSAPSAEPTPRATHAPRPITAAIQARTNMPIEPMHLTLKPGRRRGAMPDAASRIFMSSGSGASSERRSPVAGCVNAIRRAWRAWRGGNVRTTSARAASAIRETCAARRPALGVKVHRINRRSASQARRQVYADLVPAPGHQPAAKQDSPPRAPPARTSSRWADRRQPTRSSAADRCRRNPDGDR